MTSFNDGPARGQNFMLQRSPLFLRVVHDKAANKWDALDQIEDTPSKHETVYVYRLAGQPGYGFVDGTKFRGRCAFAVYQLHTVQPQDAVLRDTAEWQAWATHQMESMK